MDQDINSIIAQLAEIDSASAKIIQKTQEEKAKYAEFIHGEKQAFDASLQEEIDKAVEIYRQSVSEENKKQIEQYQKDCDDQMKILNQKFEENGQSWADKIFNNIIKE